MSAHVDKLHGLLARVQRNREQGRSSAPAPNPMEELDIDIGSRPLSKTPLQLEPVPQAHMEPTEVLRPRDKERKVARPSAVQPPAVPAPSSSKSQRAQRVEGAAAQPADDR